MILYLVAIILFLPISIINFIVVLFEYGFYLKTINGYLNKTALYIDIFANASFKTLWNKVLVQRFGYQFGQEGETISSVLGKNYQDKTLKITGKLLVLILSKKHCINAIKVFSLVFLISCSSISNERIEKQIIKEKEKRNKEGIVVPNEKINEKTFNPNNKRNKRKARIIND